MVDLYDKINKNGKSKKDTKFSVFVFVFIIIVLAVIGSLAWNIGYHARYLDFINKFSESIAYVNDNDSLKVYKDGKVLKLSEENFRGFNNYMTIYGSGKESNKIPEGEPVTFDYGDGSLLKLWDIAADKYSKRNGVFVQYTDKEGKIYSYISYKITYETIVTRYLLYDNVEISS